VNITEHTDERIMNIDLSGEDMGVLIGKRGQTLDSLQYLVSLVVNKNEEEYVRVKVDTENYRQRRKDTLENLARNISFKVRRNGKTVTLEPMNPYERRVIHSALQNDRYVETHSEGEEPFRRVVVSLKEGVKIRENNNNRHRRYGNNKNYNRNNNSKKGGGRE
jgi:spoIIIJ-associated protein